MMDRTPYGRLKLYFIYLVVRGCDTEWLCGHTMRQIWNKPYYPSI
jgi:hypothetical protein